MVDQSVKYLYPLQETQVQSLSWEDPLEKGKSTHSTILASKVPDREAQQDIVHGVAVSDVT